MKNKDQKIQEFLSQPVKKGDWVTATFQSFGHTNKEYVQVKTVGNGNVYFEKYGYLELLSCPIADLVRCVKHIGENPFKPELRGTSIQIDIESLFWHCGYDRREREERNEKYFGVFVPEVCLNPMVIDENGNEVEYQRGLVWSLEQKQLLIESIYNQIEIGKFVIRKRSFAWVENRIKKGKIEHTAFADMVDGKQRLTTLIEFIKNGFQDFNGNYFSDLSENSQKKFTSYRQLTFIELDEKSTDKDVLSAFLAINFAGVPMSKEHIEYVKSIKI